MTDVVGLSGDVQPSDYEAEEYLLSLDPVLQRLGNDIPQAGYDRRSLAQLVVQLQQFMEVALGIKSIPPRPFPKIPAKLLRDSSPYGALYSIAAKCYEITKQRGLKKIDFANPAKRKENMEILSLVRRELQREGFIKVFKVHIHPSCQSGDMPRLQRIISQLGSEIMPSEKIPGVTHIVYPFGAKGDPDDGQEYLRCLEKRGASSLVHYWYHPDSYDRCLPAEVAPEVIEPDKRIKGPWKVNPRWVLDSENYNEWMNPVDYETEDAIAEQERLGLLIEGPSGDERGTKRRSEGGEGAEQAVKKQRQDQLNRAGRRGDVEQGKGESIAPGVTRQRLVNADARWGDSGAAENLSQGQQRPSSLRGPGPKTPRAPRPAGMHACPADAPVFNGILQPESSAAQQTLPQQLYRVPAYAAWFRYDRLHAQEVRGVPEYFAAPSPTKSPRVYRDCRNLIIDRYREDPKQRLEFPAVQEAVAASHIETDAQGLRRIYDFLDAWGLVNYEAADGASHSLDSLPAAVAASGLPGTVSLGKAGGPASAAAVLSFNMPPAKNLAAPVARAGEGLQSVLTRRDAYANSATQPATPEARFFCNAMPWVDCTALRYHCTKLPDIDLCPEAYAEGRFPPGCTARDFIKIDGARTPQESPQEWSDQETLLLLEGMEMYGENWAEIAEHVSTRSQVQCVMHFLRLPIEDDLAELQPQQPLGMSVNSSGPALGSSEQPIPFADTGNPIMAQVAFLASIVSPKVAAAAAQRALEVLASEEVNSATEGDYLPPEEAENGNSEAPAPEAEPVPKPAEAEPEGPKDTTKDAIMQEAAPADASAVPADASAAPADASAAPTDESAALGNGSAAAAAAPAAAPSAIEEAQGPKVDKAADIEMQDASVPAAPEPQPTQHPSSEAQSAQPSSSKARPAQAASTEAAKEQDKPAAPEANRAPALSFDAPIPAQKLRVAAATALSAAAVKARLLADAEEREARRLTLEAAEALLAKLAAKMALFDAIAAALRQETASAEAEGDRLTAERIMLHQSQADMNAQLARLKAIQAAAQGQPMPSAAVVSAPQAQVPAAAATITGAPSSSSIPQPFPVPAPVKTEAPNASTGGLPVPQNVAAGASAAGAPLGAPQAALQAAAGEGVTIVVTPAPQQQQQALN